MKTSRTACLVAGIAFLASTPPAWVQGGNITFTGAVVAESCEIGGGHPAGARSLSPRFTVGLPAIGTDTLTTHGQTAGWSSFAITLRHCGNRHALVRTYFEPGAFVDMATGRLSPDSHSSAGNVQIALRELGSTRHILIGAPPGSQGIRPVVQQDHATLVYEAGYYALGQVSPGSVHTSVEYSLVYQ